MNEELLHLTIRLAGLACVGLIVANFIAAKRFGYARSLTGAETIVRQIFYVHCGYIVFLISALAVLCLGWPEMLREPGMGRVLSVFFGVFWTSRVVVQLSYYDGALRRAERGWDVFFLIVFGVLGVIFFTAGLLR